jgi:hypothetical protein
MDDPQPQPQPQPPNPPTPQQEATPNVASATPEVATPSPPDAAPPGTSRPREPIHPLSAGFYLLTPILAFIALVVAQANIQSGLDLDYHFEGGPPPLVEQLWNIAFFLGYVLLFLGIILRHHLIRIKWLLQQGR